jgi:nucleoside-diphosphate-sugar epimerase
MVDQIKSEAQNIVNVIDFAPLKNKNVLITGASGIIGLYLTSSLKLVQEKLNINISVWTNNQIPKYLNPIFDGCQIICGDITDSKKFINLPKYDCIIHAAGYGQPLKFVRNKIKTIKINTQSTIDLFNLLNHNGKFLFISSSEVYNGINQTNVFEDMMGNSNTDHFRSCYIEGKKCGESICHAYIENNIDVKIARLSLAYGPGTRIDDERVFNTFIKKALTEKNITLLDDGSAIRTYCYITDAVEMLWNICLHGKHVVYNVGGISTTSIYDLATTIGKSLSKSLILPEQQQSLSGNPKMVNVNCSRYIEEFNKNNFVHLNTGIDNTIRWYEKLLDN